MEILNLEIMTLTTDLLGDQPRKKRCIKTHQAFSGDNPAPTLLTVTQRKMCHPEEGGGECLHEKLGVFQ